MNKSVTVSIDGIADTGYTVLCGGLEVMRKLRIPRSVLISSNITLKTADGKPLTVLGAIPVVVTVTGNEENTVAQFLHIISELTALFISKNFRRELKILSKSFPLPEQPEESVGALGTPAK